MCYTLFIMDYEWVEWQVVLITYYNTVINSAYNDMISKYLNITIDCNGFFLRIMSNVELKTFALFMYLLYTTPSFSEK